MKKFLYSTAAAAAAVAFAGCMEMKGVWYNDFLDQRPVIFAEVMQLKASDRVYTANNLWINEGRLSCENKINNTSFIPAGTEIFPISASVDGIVFSDASGRTWELDFRAGKVQMAVEDYIRQTFTVLPPEVFMADMPPESLAAVRNGTVVPGMTREEVIVACGLPSPLRTPALTNQTWIYPTTEDGVSLRVIFRGDKVRRAETMIEGE